MNVSQHDVAEIKAQLRELIARVGEQNGRVGKLEGRADDADERWYQHDHWTPDEKRLVLDGIANLDERISKTLKSDMQQLQLEQDARRFRQMRNAAAAIILAVPLWGVVIQWMLNQIS